MFMFLRCPKLMAIYVFNQNSHFVGSSDIHRLSFWFLSFYHILYGFLKKGDVSWWKSPPVEITPNIFVRSVSALVVSKAAGPLGRRALMREENSGSVAAQGGVVVGNDRNQTFVWKKNVCLDVLGNCFGCILDFCLDGLSIFGQRKPEKKKEIESNITQKTKSKIKNLLNKWKYVFQNQSSLSQKITTSIQLTKLAVDRCGMLFLDFVDRDPTVLSAASRLAEELGDPWVSVRVLQGGGWKDVRWNQKTKKTWRNIKKVKKMVVHFISCIKGLALLSKRYE